MENIPFTPEQEARIREIAKQAAIDVLTDAAKASMDSLINTLEEK